MLFAKLDVFHKVLTVIVAEQQYVDTLPGTWVQVDEENCPGKDYKLSIANEEFIPPKPFASWVLNEQTKKWDAPVSEPIEKAAYVWDEQKQEWAIRGDL